MRAVVLTASTTVAPENQGAVTTRTADGQRVLAVAEGLVVEHGTHTRPDGTVVEWSRPLHVEQAPARLYDRVDLEVVGVVVPINGRRYRVRVQVNLDGGDDGIPDGARVSFTETTAPETPCKTWDEAAEREALLGSYRRDRAETETLLRFHEGAEERKWVEDELARLTKAIDDLEAERTKVFPRADVVFFGVPQFIQNPIFPALDGKAAQCLAVLNTDWGDCGNVNLLFACDAEGVPCKVWFEASCY
jgi:hypothetical protein